MLRALVIAAALFPWSFFAGLIIAAFIRRRKHPEYIPPSTHEPILLDSAQVSKALRRRP